MMKANDVSPIARNFYVEEDYFSLNVRNGVIRSPIGTRIVGIPEELVAGLHAGLEEETGSASAVVLYTCGKWWGKQFAKRHAQEVRHFYNMDAAELPLHFYQQVLRRVWAMYGWGVLDLCYDYRDKGFITVDVHNAMYSEVVGNIGRTSDFIIAGVLAAVVSDLAGRDLECLEIACKSKGDPKCEFIVGMKGRTDVVAAWMKQGRARAEILSAIAAGELQT
jgi:predicted hydrocarbon binding protein